MHIHAIADSKLLQLHIHAQAPTGAKRTFQIGREQQICHREQEKDNENG